MCSAFEGIGTIIPIESSMKGNRAAYPQMLRAAITLVALILGRLRGDATHFWHLMVHSFGILGYLKYGAHVDQIITQELSQTSIVVKCIRAFLVVGISCTFPLQVLQCVPLFCTQ